MKGSIDITVQNERTKYEFTIRRNITIIRGDSATGKTTLVEMLQDYKRLGEESGVELFCDRECVVVEGNDWERQLSGLSMCVVFIDEGNRFVSSTEFAKYIQKTDNYYVLVTREGLPALPYSVDEIYGIRSSGKYGGLKKVYHEMYNMYADVPQRGNTVPAIVITEDSNSGYQFFDKVCSECGILCVSANGKSNICQKILNYESENLLVIGDGAAFGSEMEKIYNLARQKKTIRLFLPESFEWLILMSDILNDKDIRSMSENWGSYIESKDYFSWERFFTALLVEKSQETYLKYNKRSLNKAYLSAAVMKKILSQMPWWSMEEK